MFKDRHRQKHKHADRHTYKYFNGVHNYTAFSMLCMHDSNKLLYYDLIIILANFNSTAITLALTA
jgi:hypothetical protein